MVLLAAGFVLTLRAKGPDWALAAVPVTLTCLLPSFSPDYKLMLTLPVLFLLVRDWDGGGAQWVALVSVALILSPQTWSYIMGTSVSLSVPLKAGELVVLLGAAVASMLATRRSQARRSAGRATEPLAAQ